MVGEVKFIMQHRIQKASQNSCQQYWSSFPLRKQELHQAYQAYQGADRTRVGRDKIRKFQRMIFQKSLKGEKYEYHPNKLLSNG
jgi:hypothetical protein